MKYAYLYSLHSEKTRQRIEYQTILSSTETFSFVKNFYTDDINLYESFFIALMKKNKCFGWAKISQGGTCRTVVDPKIVAKYAIDCLATGVILCHNHPSGILNPSREDIALTNTLKKGLELFSIKIIDHLIISENDYYSFLDNGLI